MALNRLAMSQQFPKAGTICTESLFGNANHIHLTATYVNDVRHNRYVCFIMGDDTSGPTVDYRPFGVA